MSVLWFLKFTFKIKLFWDASRVLYTSEITSRKGIYLVNKTAIATLNSLPSESLYK